jgi:hypothetical protein
VSDLPAECHWYSVQHWRRSRQLLDELGLRIRPSLGRFRPRTPVGLIELRFIKLGLISTIVGT